MIELPDFESAFSHENSFYLTCAPSRIAKMLAHYELYKKILHVPGAVVECGVFKGVSFARFAMYRALYETQDARRLIGFDAFDKFPASDYQEDEKFREQFIQNAGENSISREQLIDVLTHKGVEANVDLVAGDVCETVPDYVKENPQLKIALLNVDVDIYAPSVTILRHLYPRIVKGGLLVLDDYATYPGETKAVDEYFRENGIELRKFPHSCTPCYVVKE